MRRGRALVGVLAVGVLAVGVLAGCSLPGTRTTATDTAVVPPPAKPAHHQTRTPKPHAPKSAAPSPAPTSSPPQAVSSSTTSHTGPAAMPDAAPGAPEQWRTGVLGMVIAPEDQTAGASRQPEACLVLDTGEGRFDLLSAEGLWVPNTGVTAQRRPDRRASGISRGDGQETYGPIVFAYGQRVRILGQVLVPPPQGFPGQCHDVDGIFSVIDVEAAP